MATKKNEDHPEKKPVVVTKSESRLMVCELTDAELIERGQTMANAQQALTEIDAELESFKAQIKGRRSQAEGTVASMSSIIRQKYEHRRVECTIVENYETTTVTIYRDDTGAVVESRKMTPDEASQLPI